MQKTSDEILKRFLKAISTNEWKKAYQYCQKSWASNHSSDKLRDIFMDIKLKYILIVGEKKDKNSDYIIDYDVLCNTISGQRIHIVRLICESRSYHPDLNGDWGVNPISVLRHK